MTKIKDNNMNGYIEGYYGKLLSWADRGAILTTLAELGMGSYFYAPKEDHLHRFQWRTPYGAAWRENFHAFTADASAKGIAVIAGNAPGLDFDFGHIHAEVNGGVNDGVNSSADLDALCAKARQLAEDGASAIGLLMDDLDPGFPGRAGGFTSEGTAHASLANILAASVAIPVNITPRVYADEITEGADGYLDDFTRTLAPDLSVVFCGNHIVAHDLDMRKTGAVKAGIAPDRLMIWDNYYANDYCPRRLYIGPWRRDGLMDGQQVMLNPTGMVATDQLLLRLMADTEDNWKNILIGAGVPDAFFSVSESFLRPPHPDHHAYQTGQASIDAPEVIDAHEALDALNELLWRWKTPLSREWYPFLMALRQDILLADGQMDALRRAKTLPPILNRQLK